MSENPKATIYEEDMPTLVETSVSPKSSYPVKHVACRAGSCEGNQQELRHEEDLSRSAGGYYRALHFHCLSCHRGWVLRY